MTDPRRRLKISHRVVIGEDSQTIIYSCEATGQSVEVTTATLADMKTTEELFVYLAEHGLFTPSENLKVIQ